MSGQCNVWSAEHQGAANVWPMRFQRHFYRPPFWVHSLGRRLVVVRGIVTGAWVLPPAFDVINNVVLIL